MPCGSQDRENVEAFERHAQSIEDSEQKNVLEKPHWGISFVRFMKTTNVLLPNQKSYPLLDGAIHGGLMC